jgi:hypothetical protein
MTVPDKFCLCAVRGKIFFAGAWSGKNCGVQLSVVTDGAPEKGRRMVGHTHQTANVKIRLIKISPHLNHDFEPRFEALI